MQHDTTMNQRMDQRMILAPRMIQSMEILQLPIMALQERIAQELEENPMLERPESEPEPAAAADVSGATEVAEPPPQEPVEKPVEQKELVVDSDHNNEEDFERLLNMPDDWQEDDY